VGREASSGSPPAAGGGGGDGGYGFWVTWVRVKGLEQTKHRPFSPTLTVGGRGARRRGAVECGQQQREANLGF
jgi:hypothetical protein